MKNFLPILIGLSILLISCAESNNSETPSAELQKLQMENDSLKQMAKQSSNKISTFLTFQKGDAEQAMNFYISLFDHSEVVQLTRWGKDAPGKEGTIMQATFTLDGKSYMCSDSPPIHEWDFTPAVSNFVVCADESELKRLFTKLSENGEVMMPLGNYGFSQQFGWVVDPFGISWQLNLP
ncbi:MAG: VOC family protein [Bacteroidota bacterium]